MLVYSFVLGFLITQVSSNQSVEDIAINNTNLTGKDDNNLTWRTLLGNCKTPSVQCAEEIMYKFMKQMLEYPRDNQSVTSFIKFARNSVNYTQVKQDESRKISGDKNESCPFEEVSRNFQHKGLEFLMTHDLEVKLPETFFEGASLKIEPRNLDENGALLKLDLVPRKAPEDAVEGRIFLKKLKKKIGKKLLFALLAILLVIKLLAVKFLFFLPALVGVAAAKKLILKILFFVFPALKYLFKLCPYAPHGSKLHHHKHQISHIHHIGGGHHHAHPSHHHEGIEVIRPHADGPPLGAIGGSSLHHFVDIEPTHHTPYYHDPGPEYYEGGP